MMKKIKSFFLMVGVIGILGCGSNDKNEDKIVLKFSMWDVLDRGFFEEFEKNNPNVKIEMIQIDPSEYSQKINSMMVAGNAPDVILTFESDMERFIKNNNIVSLDEYIAKSAVKNNDFLPGFLELNEANGSVYGMPWCFATNLLYYNKDMFDKAGINYPTEEWTWEDFENAAQKLTISDNNKVIQWGADSISQATIWYSMIGAAGDNIVSKDGFLDLGDGMERVLVFQKKLTEEKIIPEPAIGGSISDLFVAKRAAMTRQGSWLIANYKNVDFNWDIAPLPKNKRHYANLHTGFFTINTTSKNKEKAWEFVNYMMSDENQKKLSKLYNNPSARESVVKNGDYKDSGANGPRNWNAFEETFEFAKIGFTLLNPGITNGLVNQFDAYLLGKIGIDEIKKEIEIYNKQIENEGI